MSSAVPSLKRRKAQIQFRLRTLLIVTALVGIVLALAAHQVHEARRQRLIIERLREQGAHVDVSWVLNSRWAQWVDTDYLESVRYVKINGAHVEDMRVFADMPNLEELYLYESGVQDVTPLAGLKKLRVLDVSGNPLSDIRPLANLQTLEELALVETQVRDISPLRELKELRMIFLWETEIVDLSPLASLKNLRELSLHHTPISDVTPLTELKNPYFIDISYTNVSDESVGELRAVFPECVIRHVKSDLSQGPKIQDDGWNMGSYRKLLADS